MTPPLNVLQTPLQPCCTAPMTGFTRNGSCETGPQDTGSHTVCAEMTKEFLEFTLSQGNDLITPRPEFSFPGLVPGNRWCVCVSRWKQALQVGKAPPVILEASNKKALEVVSLAELREHALDQQ